MINLAANTTRNVGRDRRVCVVGAGPCGLTAVKNLLAVGLNNIVCYDDGAAIGGNWVFDEHGASVYDATHLISSKRLSEFEDYPMPSDYPDYPSHQLVRAYFESYATHFGLLPVIRMETHVGMASLRSDGCWVVTASDRDGAQEEIFDDLIVCSGHHRDPFIPHVEGTFSGQSLHARDFKRAEPFRGKRVLVVGGGNSGCDIAVDIGRIALQTCLSMRRGYHFVPKLMFGRPSDVLYQKLRRLGFPKSWTRYAAEACVRFNVGPPEKYGLAPPVGRLFEMHPTLNSDILSALRDGRVFPRAGIERLNGAEVRFSDGRSESFDVIIWATGYDFGTGALKRLGVRGRDGLALEEYWAEGPRTYLGITASGFPNFFFPGGPHGAGGGNYPRYSQDQVDWIVGTLMYAREHGFDVFEPTEAQQVQWMTMIETLAPKSIFSAEHSHYYGANVEGKVRKFLLNPGGRGKLHEILNEASSTENYGGAFSRAVAAVSAG